MGPAARAFRLWNTARHLRPIQVVGRLRFKFARPRPDLRAAPPVRLVGACVPRPAARAASLVSPSRLRLLGVERDIDAVGWDDHAIAKLWRYNLHYFDDLCSEGAEGRASWHRSLIDRWIAENPAGRGTGWEPYPTSLRIVNWMKWAWLGNPLGPTAVQSLAVQARWLSKRLEWHLLGNHLFVNAKALVFAGSFFEGDEADRWFRVGASILRREIPEQILPDGGQFERSPMYHALALEDMLDLCGAATVRDPGELGDAVRSRIEPMRRWLGAMCHPDGEIAFFNDAAIGVHPSPSELNAYAMRLGFGSVPPPADGVTNLVSSGYVRLQLPGAVVLFDVGEVGPAYLPGHAHADTLSFELSIGGRRVAVNSGTSEYGIGAERSRQRGTMAHNTVSIGGMDSSEVWGGFRVARRARPFGAASGSGPAQGLFARCGHDGFRRTGIGSDHVRELRLGSRSLEIIDEVSGAAGAVAAIHWAPGMEPPAGPVRITTAGGRITDSSSTWHPGFGDVRANRRTLIHADGPRLVTRLEW
jgi:uncharacterized heparinase superfamily protein